MAAVRKARVQKIGQGVFNRATPTNYKCKVLQMGGNSPALFGYSFESENAGEYHYC